jgi:Flp pilus assembly pilin Flp
MQSYIRRKISKNHGKLGLSTVEYIIILCLIAVVCFGVWKKFGETVRYTVQGADTQIGQLPTQTTTP